MDPLSPVYRFSLCLAVIALAAIFCVANICRSVKLQKGLSQITIKMYVTFLVISVAAVVGLAGAIQSDAFVGLLGALLGYVLGEKVWMQEEKQEK